MSCNHAPRPEGPHLGAARTFVAVVGGVLGALALLQLAAWLVQR